MRHRASAPWPQAILPARSTFSICRPLLDGRRGEVECEAVYLVSLASVSRARHPALTTSTKSEYPVPSLGPGLVALALVRHSSCVPVRRPTAAIRFSTSFPPTATARPRGAYPAETLRPSIGRLSASCCALIAKPIKDPPGTTRARHQLQTKANVVWPCSCESDFFLGSVARHAQQRAAPSTLARGSTLATPRFAVDPRSPCAPRGHSAHSTRRPAASALRARTGSSPPPTERLRPAIRSYLPTHRRRDLRGLAGSGYTDRTPPKLPQEVSVQNGRAKGMTGRDDKVDAAGTSTYVGRP
ncbi:hypothetical protein BKA93DRAFT_827896 [Sparassis latifolia]